MNLKDLIKAARGDQPADFLFTNARIVNVFSGEIISDHIAVSDGYIIGLGDYPAHKTIDIKNRFVAPGFIDAHVHIESSMVSVSEFAKAVLPRGTTTVVADPHEIANVMGVDGIKYMLEASEKLPMNMFFTLPSCVPATNMETAGAMLDAEKLRPFLSRKRIVGLGEMMNFPGVISGDRDVICKIENTFAHGKPVDGHAPGLSGKELNAYAASGVSSDHECVTPKEAMEKLRAGMYIMIREGTGAKNLNDLLPVINPKTARRIMWCTDDRHPHDICGQGHIDFIIRCAIAYGVDPITAIGIGTLNPAQYFGLRHLGAIAPGRKADMVVFSDLQHLVAEEVYAGGNLVASGGQMNPDVELEVEPKVKPKVKPELKTDKSQACLSTMHVKDKQVDFTILTQKKQIRVIELVADQIFTRQLITDAVVENNFAVSDTSKDILKIAVIERHKGTGNVGRGFIKGVGLKQGAIASSVAHDSHNIIVVGVNDDDMEVAVKRIIELNGGLVAVKDQKVAAGLALPIAGLMSPDPLKAVRNQMDQLINAAHEFGAIIPDPFMILSFLALPVIPELKLTDLGLFDVLKFKHVSLFVD